MDVKKYWACIEGFSSNFVLELDFNSVSAKLDKVKAEMHSLASDYQKLKDNHKSVSINLATHERRASGREKLIAKLQRKHDAALIKNTALTTEKDAAMAAIQFALNEDDGMAFLRLWKQGDFDAIRREWPGAPEAVFISDDLTAA